MCKSSAVGTRVFIVMLGIYVFMQVFVLPMKDTPQWLMYL